MKSLAISAGALEEARQQGLYGATEKRLKRMARRSVPVPGSKTLRRFLCWELTIKDATIMGVERLIPMPM